MNRKKTRLKICGLRTVQDVAWVNQAGADYAGFVIHVPGSRRSISAEMAGKLSSMLDPGIRAVGVFVNEPEETVAALLNTGVIACAQLHGQEDQRYLRNLRTLTDGVVIQAYSIENKNDIRKAENSGADYILLDHGKGGTGKTFDWDLIGELSRPWFLAGGLHCGNLAEAVRRLRPFAVDLSSGVETDDKKDREKIRRAAEILRELEKETNRKE